MKLGHKLLLAPVMTAVVVLATGQLDSKLLRSAGENATGRFVAELDDIQSLSNVQNQIGQMHTGIYRAMTIMGSYDEGQIIALRKDMADRSAMIKVDLAALMNRGDIDAQARSDMEAASRLIDDYLKRSDLAVDLASVDPNTGVAAMQGADEAYVQMAKSVADATKRMREIALEASQVSATQTNRTHWLLSLLSLLVAAGVVGLFWVVLRRVAVALEQASHVAREIAGGNLDVRVESSRQDELGDLLKALDAMKSALVHTVGQVRSASDSIGSASAEIASGNQDLSARTEQAASNLEETAASMEELTATVRQSADAARQANQLAASASEIAVRGGRVVSQVVATMNEINHSSKKINDIIGVIDGIAFQTNILALNAAVEAARAGEQGRGFAVVAGEVRNLAQRSAEAAKEIKGLIGASVDRVEAGSRLVADAGQTMSEIVGSVQRVSDIIGEITAASAEQSDGIGQVNTAVSQLDQMTQQNAALVEESAAAAESLKEQARRLVQVVQVFRIDGSGATAFTPPVRHQAPAHTAPTPGARSAAKAVHAPAAATPRAAPEVKRPAPERVSPPNASTVPAPVARPLPVKPAKATVGAGDEGDWESF